MSIRILPILWWYIVCFEALCLPYLKSCRARLADVYLTQTRGVLLHRRAMALTWRNYNALDMEENYNGNNLYSSRPDTRGHTQC